MGGARSFITPLDGSIIKNTNEIFIRVNNLLNNSHTIPLANLINYPRNYGGINKDIYIIAVPKIYVSESIINYKFESENTLNITNTVEINSDNFSSLKIDNSEIIIKTKLYKLNADEPIAESSPVKLTIEDFQTVNVTNEFIAKNLNFWSPENPELYTIVTVIQNSSNNVIDEKPEEIGFVDSKIRGDNILINRKTYTLNGINYYEDSPKFGNALDYSELESDLKRIKDYGFNCIRVPGKPAHPYILNICNRIGLFVMNEIPFNEVPSRILKDENYIQFSVDYLESIIKRDKNSPSVICWGIGNNFDVTGESAGNYVKNVKEAAAKLDSRPLYYTTRNIKNDICSEYLEIKGINLTTNSFEKIQEYTNDIKFSGRQNQSVFISSYGMSINNDNRNGFGDKQSVEAQAKFITESYRILSKSFFANFISSYSDWNAVSPLNIKMNANPYLKTEGIFDFYREPKSSALIIKRLINGQGFQKIPEGSGEIMNKDNYFVFIVTGLISIIFFFFLLGKLRYFKSNIIKSIISPKNFIYFVKEQMLIATYRNIILNFLIALSLGLFFASVIYLFRENIFLDMLLSSVFTDHETKINIAYVINSPVNLLLLISVAAYLNIIIITSLAFLFDFLFIKKSNIRTIYTITIWSFIPFLIFLLIGTVFYKLSGEGSAFITVTFVLFILIYSYCYIKLFHGYKIIFDLSALKVVIYGLVIFIFVHFVAFAYFYYIKSTLNVFDLILSYKY